MFRGRIAVTVVALAWLAGGTFAAYAAAGVSVQGNKRVDSETIGGYFTGTDQASINKGVKDLYATGLFSDVRVSRVGDPPGSGAGRDCRNPRQPLSLNPCHVQLRLARQRREPDRPWDSHF